MNSGAAGVERQSIRVDFQSFIRGRFFWLLERGLRIIGRVAILLDPSGAVQERHVLPTMYGPHRIHRPGAGPLRPGPQDLPSLLRGSVEAQQRRPTIGRRG